LPDLPDLGGPVSETTVSGTNRLDTQGVWTPQWSLVKTRLGADGLKHIVCRYGYGKWESVCDPPVTERSVHGAECAPGVPSDCLACIWRANAWVDNHIRYGRR